MADDTVHLGELATESTDPPAAVAPRRRGRRALIGILIALVVLAVLAVIGWFVAESVLRQVAADRIRTVVVDGLGVDPDEVDVEVGGGAIVPQLLAGSLDSVVIGLDELTIGAVSGAATLTAEGVPLAEGGTIERVVAVATIDPDSVAQLAAGAAGLSADAITVGDDTITVAAEIDAFITTVRVAVDLRPSALDGAIALEPVSVTLGDTVITADELRSTPIIGDAAAGLLQTQVVCIASTLPASLALTDLGIADGELTVTLRGTAVPTDQRALSTTGTC